MREGEEGPRPGRGDGGRPPRCAPARFCSWRSCISLSSLMSAPFKIGPCFYNLMSEQSAGADSDILAGAIKGGVLKIGPAKPGIWGVILAIPPF